jgi:hypothetical protein
MLTHHIDSLPPSPFSLWTRVIKLSVMSAVIGSGMTVTLYAAYEYPLVLYHWSLVLSDYLKCLERLDVSSQHVETTSTSIKSVHYMLPMTAALQRLWAMIFTRNLIAPGASKVRQRSESMFKLRMKAFSEATPGISYQELRDYLFPPEGSLDIDQTTAEIEQYLKTAEQVAEPVMGIAVSPMYILKSPL